jgi:hypothetical protein
MAFLLSFFAGVEATSANSRHRSARAWWHSPEPKSDTSRPNNVTLGARLTVLITITGLMVACGSQRPGAGSPASLVTGIVAAGPISPLAQPGVPATRPVQGATVEALRGDQVMATTYTDQAGRYELRLQPGTYVIRAQSDKYLSREKSKEVSLSRGQRVTANLVLDTGIR